MIEVDREPMLIIVQFTYPTYQVYGLFSLIYQYHVAYTLYIFLQVFNVHYLSIVFN